MLVIVIVPQTASPYAWVRLLDFKHKNNQQDGKEQHPVHAVDIDLGTEMGRSIFNPQQWQDTGRDALVDNGKYPEIIAWEAITVAAMLSMRKGI